MRTITTVLSIPIMIAGLVAVAAAETHLVRQNGTGDYTTIEAAVAAAAPGDLILVGPGLYTPEIYLEYGLDFASESGPEATVLSGEDSHRIIRMVGSFASDIAGFTFTDAYVPYGKAMGSCLSIAHGGDLHVENCVFRDSYAGWDAAGIMAAYAGAVVEVVECRFEDNYAFHAGAACATIQNGRLTIRDSIFVENTCDTITGAVASWYATLIVEESLFLRNSALAAGALTFDHSKGWARNSTFHDNLSPHHATALVMYSPDVVFDHNIVTSEIAGYGLKYLYLGTPAPHDCNIFYDNAQGPVAGDALQPDELVADPLYCHHPSDDFSLCVLSMGLPENNECGLIGHADQGCDECGPIAVETASWGRVKSFYR